MLLTTAVSQATGFRGGDYFSFANAWASFTITRQKLDVRIANISETWDVQGDVEKAQSFPNLADALRYGFAQLAEFERGRAD